MSQPPGRRPASSATPTSTSRAGLRQRRGLDDRVYFSDDSTGSALRPAVGRHRRAVRAAAGLHRLDARQADHAASAACGRTADRRAFVKALVRWLLWIVDGFPYFLPLVGFISASPPSATDASATWPPRRSSCARIGGGSPIVVPGLTAPPPVRARRRVGRPAARPRRRDHGLGSGRRPELLGLGQPHAAGRRADPHAPSGPQWDEARGTYIQWDPPRRVDAVGRGHEGLVPHPRPDEHASVQPRSRMAIERRRRSRWCSRERVARCSTSVVASDGGSLSA